MSSFDFQWQFIPSPNIDYTEERIKEFVNFTQIDPKWFKGKKCLDAGCGNGRYTYAMQQLGGVVTSFDASIEAVKKCREINSMAFQQDIFYLVKHPIYDFVLSWGVLHHTPDPEAAFMKVAEMVKKGGYFHVYLYHEKSQKQYAERRRIFKSLKTLPEKMKFAQAYADKEKADLHGVWDSLVPEFNFGLNVPQVRGWFEKAGFKDIRVITEVDINMNAIKK